MKLDCIYFLFDGPDLVYIGQTRNMKWRIPNHFDKVWTHVRWIPCERSKMFYWEKRLIKYFDPEYNIQFTPRHMQGYKALMQKLRDERKLVITHPERKKK